MSDNKVTILRLNNTPIKSKVVAAKQQSDLKLWKFFVVMSLTFQLNTYQTL